MYADPECVGELLLVGVALARTIDLGTPPLTGAGTIPARQVSEAVYGRRWLATTSLLGGVPAARADSDPYQRVRDVYHADRRRYDPDADARLSWRDVVCGRPMLRRAGLCGRAATVRRRLTDPATGTRSWVGACSHQACRTWLAGLVDRNRAELVANPAPQPAANCGGVLQRHLPEIDWWEVWAAVDPRWTPPAEGRPAGRAVLTLLVDDQAEPVVSACRPALRVLDGGWR
jgi:hypothetical protein